MEIQGQANFLSLFSVVKGMRLVNVNVNGGALLRELCEMPHTLLICEFFALLKRTGSTSGGEFSSEF